jgi:ubiquinone/menaquinone biosynthesis C-methylase UbiE
MERKPRMTSEVRSHYEEWNEVMEEERIDREDKEFVLKNLKSIKARFILDVGCGYGRHLKFLREKNFNALGIDIANNLLKKSQIIRRRYTSRYSIFADKR